MALDQHIKAIGFDMDGTLMDTKVDYVKLARVVEDEYVSLGVPEDVLEKDRKENSTVAGMTWLKVHKPETLQGMEKRVGDRATAVECENADIAKPFPGTIELVKKIRGMGYKTAVLTRGGREYATRIMGRFGMLELFDVIIARDDYPYNEAKPSIKAMQHVADAIGVKCEDILYLGDGEADYFTTVNSRSPFIGVESGHKDREAWVKIAGESVVTIPTVADLERFL